MRRLGTTSKAGLTTVLGIAGIAVILVAWQLASWLGVVDETSFPPPSDVLPEVVDLFGSSAFWSATADTFESTALGLGNTGAFAALGLTSLFLPHVLAWSSWPVVWLLAAGCALIAWRVLPAADR